MSKAIETLGELRQAYYDACVSLATQFRAEMKVTPRGHAAQLLRASKYMRQEWEDFEVARGRYLGKK